jgi:hypothetical protein
MSGTFQATVFIKLQNFNGDSAGNLTGNYGIYGTQAATVTQTNPPMGPLAATIGNLNVTTRFVSGEDPLVTLDNALKARVDLPELTEV